MTTIEEPFRKITLNTPWFEYVRDGVKKFEGRRFINGRFHKGQTLTVAHATSNLEQPYKVIVKDIMEFPTFKDALHVLPIEEVLPGVESVDEGCYVYQNYVALDIQKREGIIMLMLDRDD
jgi:ASC-1-like (ASCH) protein